MHLRSFSNTSHQLSEIGYGGWGIGGSWWGKELDDESSRRSLRLAVDQGVNFFDTALVYGQGHSEQLMGRVLREKNKTTYLASKIPPKNYQWPAAPDSRVQEVYPREWIVECVEQSLKHLRMEQMFLAQFHVWSDHWLEQEGDWWDAVQDLKKQGKILHWGVSVNDHQPSSVLGLVESGRADSVQTIFNIFDQSPLESLLPLCLEKEVAVIARVPFDEGSLGGVWARDQVFPEGDFRRDYFGGGRLQDTLDRVERIRALCQAECPELPQAALKFCLSHPAVTTVIPGMRKPEHVLNNCRASDGRPLSPELIRQLHQHAWNRNFYSH